MSSEKVHDEAEVPMQLDAALPEYFIIADTPTPSDTVLDPKIGCQWYNMMGSTLQEVEARIQLLMVSKTPVHVVSVAHQGLLEENTVEEVFESIVALHEKAIASKMHRFTVGSCIFVPDLYQKWDSYALLNQRLRQLAIDSHQQPLFLHKPLLERIKDRSVLCVNPSYFVEFLAQSSLGRTLTRDGQKKIMNPVVKHLTIGMLAKDPLVAKNDPSALAPTPIGLTPKFLRSPSMREHMRQRGMFVATAKKDGARSLSRARSSDPKRRKPALPTPPPLPPPYKSEVKIPKGYRIPNRRLSPLRGRSSNSSVEDTPRQSTSKAPSSPKQSTSSGFSSSSARMSRPSSSGSSVGYRSRSENEAADLTADRQENDLSDLVFMNSLTDPDLQDDPVVLMGDQRERYNQMFNAYSQLITQNYALRMDVKALNIQLTDLQRFKLTTLNKKCPSMEKQLETANYYVSRAEHRVRMLKNQLATEKSEGDRILGDFYSMRDQRDELRKERDLLREEKDELARMYDQLVEDDTTKKAKKKKAKK